MRHISCRLWWLQLDFCLENNIFFAFLSESSDGVHRSHVTRPPSPRWVALPVNVDVVSCCSPGGATVTFKNADLARGISVERTMKDACRRCVVRRCTITMRRMRARTGTTAARQKRRRHASLWAPFSIVQESMLQATS